MKLAVLLVLTTTTALAHDAGDGAWMNHMSLIDPVNKQWCCNDLDCAPIPANGVREQADGMFIAETGEVIAIERVIWRAPDGRWWRCRYLAGEEKGKTRCLIGPPKGT